MTILATAVTAGPAGPAGPPGWRFPRGRRGRRGTRRTKGEYRHLELFDSRDWGLIIYDEVH
ncbi:hypothetical protein ACNJQJ_21560, partial [Mycobacterium tuberculosis]